MDMSRVGKLYRVKRSVNGYEDEDILLVLEKMAKKRYRVKVMTEGNFPRGITFVEPKEFFDKFLQNGYLEEITK